MREWLVDLLEALVKFGIIGLLGSLVAHQNYRWRREHTQSRMSWLVFSYSLLLVFVIALGVEYGMGSFHDR